MAIERVGIDSDLHETMKALAKKHNRNTIDEYREAIRRHIIFKSKEQVFEDSLVEAYLNKKFEKMDKHLSSMMAKNTIDTNIAVAGILKLVSRLEEKDFREVYEELKKYGLEIFKSSEK